MTRTDHFILKRHYLRHRIQTQDLKMWWLADMAGVHKTTLRRWLSGRIRTIQAEHLYRLASLLNISCHDLVQHTTT